MYYKKLLPVILFVVLSISAFADVVRPIEGRVYEQETGLPLAGASVSIKGTNQSTISQSDGMYHINAEVGQTLVFAYLKMVTQEVIVTVNSANIDVELFIDT